jgi:hypothetical protein
MTVTLKELPVYNVLRHNSRVLLILKEGVDLTGYPAANWLTFIVLYSRVGFLKGKIPLSLKPLLIFIGAALSAFGLLCPSARAELRGYDDCVPVVIQGLKHAFPQMLRIKPEDITEETQISEVTPFFQDQKFSLELFKDVTDLLKKENCSYGGDLSLFLSLTKPCIERDSTIGSCAECLVDYISASDTKCPG